MSVKDSLKAKLATAATAITLIASPGAFSADDNADADLAMHNKTEITQPHDSAVERTGHLPLPTERYRNAQVPIAAARPGDDGISAVPIMLSYYHRQMHENLSNGPTEIVLTVIKGKHEAANRKYERAVAQMASNVSSAYEDENTKVTYVLGVHADPGTHDGKGGSPSYGIGLYINNQPERYFFPQDLTVDSLIENIKEVQTNLIYHIENGDYLLNKDQWSEKVAERKASKQSLTTTTGDDTSSGGAAEQDNTPMASL